MARYFDHLAVALVAFASAQTAFGFRPLHFFENSRRRDADKEELRGLVYLPGCMGFYVKNGTGRTLVMTARHCVNYDMDAWCSKGGKVMDLSTREEKTCKRVVAGDKIHDPVLIEVAGARSWKTFSLAGYQPKDHTRLKMIGFPGDKYASGNIMVTENCWVLSQWRTNPFVESDYWKKGLHDDSFTHNCSTYGGNSGGPMLIEGTEVVVGLPYNYAEDEFGNKVFWAEEAYGATINDFVASFAGELAQAKVTVQRYRFAGTPGKYFSANSYRSGTLACEFRVVPLYLTGPRVESLKVNFSCKGDEYSRYECNDKGSCDYKGSRIFDMTPAGFSYEDPDGEIHHFKS